MVKPGVIAHHQRALELNSSHITQDPLSYSTCLRRNIQIYFLHFTNLKLYLDNKVRSTVNTVSKFHFP
jgi:hypothetical protein